MSNRFWGCVFVIACMWVLTVVGVYAVCPVTVVAALKAMGIIGVMCALLLCLDWWRLR